MHPHSAHFADGATVSHHWGLTRMAATPCRLLPFCSGTLSGKGYGGWFSPSTGLSLGSGPDMFTQQALPLAPCNYTFKTTGY